MGDVIELWTDGACAGNPGPGGYAALLRVRGGERIHEREIVGGEKETTNNRMELMAVIVGLRALTRACAVNVHLDSSYVMNAFAQNWVDAWRARNWMTASKEPVKNRDLWEQLLIEVARHQVQWIKVKGHAGVEANERVDALAVAERDRAAAS
jgi:ribonuclease HI